MSELIGYTMLGVSVGLVYGLLALGIVLIYKGTRIINFAHTYLALLCAFVTWWLTAKASFLPFEEQTRPRFVVAAIIGLALTALNGYSLEHSLFRRLRNAPRITQLVATLAVAQGTLGLVVLLFARNQAQAEEARFLPSVVLTTFHVGDFLVIGAYLQMLLVVPVVAIAIALFFTKTKFGVAVRAAADNRDAARLLGISADRVASFTWMTGSLLAGLAGLLIVPISGLDPATLSTGFLVRALAAALIGGLTSLPGAVLGGVLVGVTESLLDWRTDTPGLSPTLLFAAVLLVLLVRPGGLLGKPEGTEDRAALVPPIRELPARYRLSDISVWFGRYWAFTAIAFAVAMSQVVSGSTNKILIDVLVFAIVGVSLTVLMGFSGQISLGHWALVGVGAFTVANVYSESGWPFPVAVVAAVVVGMVVSLLLALPSLRIRGLYLAVVTLAFHLAAEFFLFRRPSIGGRSAGITVDAPKIGPFDLDAIDHKALFLFALVGLLLSMWVARNLSATRTGRGFFALRENERAAATLGIPLARYRILAFAVSGGMAGLAGAVHVLNQGIATSSDFGTAISISLVAMVVIGGLGSVEGAVLGAFVVVGLPNLLEFDNQWIVPIGTGILLFVVISRAPGGLAGLLHLSRKELVVDLVDLQERNNPPAVEVRGPSSTGAALAD
jgi:ABC-type branched-subunit amino acid transport system permease subunit